MTHRRQQVLDYLIDAHEAGQRVTLSRIVRACALYDKSSAVRIVRDLRRMDLVG